jgi:L-asparagine transporter-like permease
MNPKPILTVVLIMLCAAFLVVLIVTMKAQDPVEIMLLMCILFMVALISVQVNIIRNDEDDVQ